MPHPTNERIKKIKSRLPIGSIERIKEKVSGRPKCYPSIVSRTLGGLIAVNRWDERHDFIIEQAEAILLEWISVDDRMPTVCGDYLVTDGDAQMVASMNLSGVFDFFENSKFWEHENVTHWMPLPELPQKKGDR